MSTTKIGVIGGSGIYDIDGLQNPKWQQVESPWGVPSDELLTGQLAGVEMVFLPRHGRGHVHAPSDVPYRANIDALKRLGGQMSSLSVPAVRFATRWSQDILFWSISS